jgi:proteic killer suppression protein
MEFRDALQRGLGSWGRDRSGAYTARAGRDQASGWVGQRFPQSQRPERGLSRRRPRVRPCSASRYFSLASCSARRSSEDAATRRRTIRSFKNREAEELLKDGATRGISADVAKAATRRLQQLDQAATVDSLREPPGNRLHKVGEAWAIRVNRQYRITFTWGADGPEEVWFGDYH